MEINIHSSSGYYILNLKGDLDASNCISVDNAIQTAIDDKEKNILVNMKDLNYISSAGLGVFISYLSEFENKGIYFAVTELNEKVLNTFKILGLDKVVTIIKNPIKI